MAEKVTTMVLNTVDLQCSSGYKKVKKVLCKFPQIRDQVYDEKNNKVTIKVLCCSPEKIRDKLCCKGGKVIINIEILEPQPELSGKPRDPPDSPKLVPVNFFCVPVQGCPGYPPMYLSGACCGSCSEGSGGGPCFHGYVRPVTPPPGPCYVGYRYPYRGSKCCVNGDYFSEENAQGCTIM